MHRIDLDICGYNSFCIVREFWTLLDTFGHVWTLLDTFGHVWTRESKTTKKNQWFWTRFGFGHVWTRTKSKPIVKTNIIVYFWTLLDKFGHVWTRLILDTFGHAQNHKPLETQTLSYIFGHFWTLLDTSVQKN